YTVTLALENGDGLPVAQDRDVVFTLSNGGTVTVKAGETGGSAAFTYSSGDSREISVTGVQGCEDSNGNRIIDYGESSPGFYETLDFSAASQELEAKPVNLAFMVSGGDNMTYTVTTEDGKEVKIETAAKAIIETISATIKDNPGADINAGFVIYANRGYKPGDTYPWGIGEAGKDGEFGHGLWYGIQQDDLGNLVTDIFDPEAAAPAKETLAYQLSRFAYMKEHDDSQNDFLGTWLNKNVDFGPPDESKTPVQFASEWQGSSTKMLHNNNYQAGLDATRALVEEMHGENGGSSEVYVLGGFMANSCNTTASDQLGGTQTFKISVSENELEEGYSDALFSYGLNADGKLVGTNAFGSVEVEGSPGAYTVTVDSTVLLGLHVYDRQKIEIGGEEYMAVYHANAIYLYRWCTKDGKANYYRKDDGGTQYTLMKGQLYKSGAMNESDLHDVWMASGESLSLLNDTLGEGSEASFIGLFEGGESHDINLLQYVDFLVHKGFLEAEDLSSYNLGKAFDSIREGLGGAEWTSEMLGKLRSGGGNDIVLGDAKEFPRNNLTAFQ
ncbi:MAG: hypothetical protein K6E40_07805, partial [Desulfovibrio sp.]|nr:hypothetical protein [Desulfovibrio sp.]